jgi:hypothetical protein
LTNAVETLKQARIDRSANLPCTALSTGGVDKPENALPTLTCGFFVTAGATLERI